jgi:hypothetical protein
VGSGKKETELPLIWLGTPFLYLGGQLPGLTIRTLPSYGLQLPESQHGCGG